MGAVAGLFLVSARGRVCWLLTPSVPRAHTHPFSLQLTAEDIKAVFPPGRPAPPDAPSSGPCATAEFMTDHMLGMQMAEVRARRWGGGGWWWDSQPLGLL